MFYTVPRLFPVGGVHTVAEQLQSQGLPDDGYRVMTEMQIGRIINYVVIMKTGRIEIVNSMPSWGSIPLKKNRKYKSKKDKQLGTETHVCAKQYLTRSLWELK